MSTQIIQSLVPSSAKSAAEFTATLLGRDNIPNLLAALGRHTVQRRYFSSERNAYEVVFRLRDSLYSHITTQFRIADNGESYYLQSACDCAGNNGCIHPKIAFLAYHASAIRGFQEALDEVILNVGSLSKDSVELLSLIRNSSRKTTLPLSTSSSQKGRMLFYVLDERCDKISVISTRVLATGSPSEKFKFEEDWGPYVASGLASFNGFTSRSPYLSAPVGEQFGREDMNILRSFVAAGWKSSRSMFLHDVAPDAVFHLAAKSSRFILGAGNYDKVLSIGEPRSLDLAWQGSDSDKLYLTIVGSDQDLVLLPTSPRWYLNTRTLQIGAVLSEVSDVAFTLLKRRDVGIDIEDIEKFRRSLCTIDGATEALPAIPEIQTLDMGLVQPIPVLRVRRSKAETGETVGQLIADIQFDYLGKKAGVGKEKILVSVDGINRVKMKRDKEFEKSVLRSLSKGIGDDIARKGAQIIADPGGLGRNSFIGQVVQFQSVAENLAKENGWKVEYEDCHIEVTDGGEWEISLDETEQGWYNLAMHVVINGIEVSMIDVLRQILRQPMFSEWLASDGTAPDDVWYHELVDGRALSIPQYRVKKLARIMLELGSGDSQDGSVRISRFDVGFLDDLGDDTHIRGGESLRKLAEALSAPLAALPGRIHSDIARPLRDYQVTGVSWLRKLKAAGVGAILGDEMGAGKTIQLLAHVWLNALDNPDKISLIVVPVSLVAKWLGDAAVFLPDLKFGKMLSGESDSWTEAITESHAVITTYAMLVRHEHKFAEVEWDVVAFDEAHELRNSDAKMTHAAMRIRGAQKIAVTGTPLQNRPEEWWSIYTLVTPGLFRDRKWFRSVFVNGLKDDQILQVERLRLMGRIGAPFRLARTNKEVNNILPALEVEYHYVNMEAAQSEIYEAMRANLDGEVRKLLNESGLARSHIQVLTAINRLRQIAADPRLTKMDSLPNTIRSAKVDYILSLCRDMAFEGKKIFIVSEWSEYLFLIANHLKEIGLTHRVLHGKLSRDRREEAVASFRCGLASVLLSTLKVGGVGLDIPEGDVCILATPWWNPKAVDQAIARLRRDDSKPMVKAIHVIARGTLEEGVVKIGERKRSMISAVTEGANEVPTTLSVEDIESLLGYV